MIEPLENMRDLQSVNAKQRVGGVDAERSAPHISGVTPAMQRLAERRGIVPVDDRDVSSTSGDDSDASDAFDSSALVGAAGDRTSGSIWPVVERSILMRFSRTALHWCSLIRVVWLRNSLRA